ncbi:MULTISPECIES: hypothetical protein [Bacillus]|nr:MULTISPECIES: hypothetical protein [Bacillus]
MAEYKTYTERTEILYHMSLILIGSPIMNLALSLFITSQLVT